MKLVWHPTPCSCLIMHVSVWFMKTMPFMCKCLVRQWLPCSCLVRHISVWLCSYLHQNVTTFTSQHETACHHETQWESRKILLLCHADIVYCRIHSSQISLTKYRTHSLKTSLIVETKTEERALGCTSKHHTATVAPCSFVAFSATPSNGTVIGGQFSPSSSSRGINSPMQWLRAKRTGLHFKNHPRWHPWWFQHATNNLILPLLPKLTPWVWQDSAQI